MKPIENQKCILRYTEQKIRDQFTFHIIHVCAKIGHKIGSKYSVSKNKKDRTQNTVV